ncbi:MAG TPA: arsenate reductase ArsC [Pyrinomonadaceae bacterium]|mgnify:CR=1 FL=1|nr:arsenate reductase ArsC [Pyrinomonadaceae bacterium]
MSNETKSVLILCTGNSARSQMAEGLLKHICGDKYVIESAGTRPIGVSPESIEVLKEVGIDISSSTSKSVDVFADREFDYVLTVCDNARENCPYFPARTKLVHHAFEDPWFASGGFENRLEAFRRVRDEIDLYLRNDFVKNVLEA